MVFVLTHCTNKKSAGKSCKTAVDRHQMTSTWKKITYKKIDALILCRKYKEKLYFRQRGGGRR